MEELLDISLERAANRGEASALKIQIGACEINVWLTDDDIERLGMLRAASWDARQSIRAGVSAGMSVFWATTNDRVTIMVGEDDETWDIAVSFVGVDRLLTELGV